MLRLNQLEKKGRHFRKILNFLDSLPHLFSADDLYDFLRKRGIKIDKSSVYRNLKKLESKQIIKSVEQEKGKTYYEKNIFNHHHHLICQKCFRVESFSDDQFEEALGVLVKKLKKRKDYQNFEHRLTLWGLCSSCS